MNRISRTIRRRRIESKTDYRARLALLKSEKIRLVVRKTNRYIIAQLVDSELAQDRVVVGVSSKDLLSQGWSKEDSGKLKNRAACYLTGALLANKAKDKLKEPCILDMGINRNVKGSRLYSVVKGFVDAGGNISFSEECLPQMDKIENNKKILASFKKIKEALI